MKRHITSGIAIGMLVVVATITGGSIWFFGATWHTALDGKKSTFLSSACRKPDSEARKIVFLGDSITAYGDWSAYSKDVCIINAGVPGNTTDDVLARLDGIVGSKPEKLFLMIGINDFLRGKDAGYVAANIGKIIKRIEAESPDTTIFIQSVLPTNNDLSNMGSVDSRTIVALNDKLKSSADGSKTVFVDLYPFFCGADSKLYRQFAEDGVHPSPDGYAVWKRLIGRYLR